MTEQDWLTCNKPQLMLDVITKYNGLRSTPPGFVVPYRASDRKLRLFLCACCRHLWDKLTDTSSKYAVETAEKFADGEATEKDLYNAHWDQTSVTGAWIAHYASRPPSTLLLSLDGMTNDREGEGPSQQVQIALIREIFGNPFRQTTVTGPNNPSDWQGECNYPLIDTAVFPCKKGNNGYIPWRGGLIHYTALNIYQRRAWGELTILADMLEDSRLGNHLVLEHLRTSESHYLGCWALDLLCDKR